jgi:hypothetical protein
MQMIKRLLASKLSNVRLLFAASLAGRNVRVRGHAKVACHLMFGILALTCDQLLRLIN